MLELIIKYYGDVTSAVATLGGTTEILSPTIAIVTIDEDKAGLLAALKEIDYIELPIGLSLNMSESLYHACVTPNAVGDLTGRGVIVALIDSGIDYTHPDFRNDDGTTRIKYLWDMTAEGTPPPGFAYGHVYDEAAINAALSAKNPLQIIPQNDTIGHGTAVASVAAGNGRASGGREAGVAPQADIVAVKLGRDGSVAKTRTIELMRGLKFVADTAASLNQPCAVNISFGTNRGAHDEHSLFEQYISEVAALRHMSVIVAAGNEGSAGHHFSGNLKTGQTETVEFIVSGGVVTVYLVMWSDFADKFAVEIIQPVLPSDDVVNIDIRQATHYSPYQMIFVDIRNKNAEKWVTPGIWKFVVTSISSVSGDFHIWLPTTEEVSRATAFVRPNPAATITMPATADGVIAVGAYNPAQNSYAQFSGRGFADGHMPQKPDLVAPGVGVVASRAGGGYDSYSGTSIAAPFVTGAAALMMQWGIVEGNNTDMYGQRLLAYLHRTAGRSAQRAYPNDMWGYGALCLGEALKAAKADA